MEFTIILPYTIVVEMNNGATATIPMADMSAVMIENAVLLGLPQKVRNFAASALMNCRIAVAGDKRNDETDKAYAKRLEAVTVSTETLRNECQACMVAGIERLKKGDWKLSAKAAGTSITKAFADWLIGKFGPVFDAQMTGFAEAKVPEKRQMIDEWLDDKEGRRTKYEREFAAWEAEQARKASAINIDDL